MRKTKIVCTLGLQTDNKDMIRKLAHAGMNVARINMAHGDFEEQENKINNIKAIRDELKMPLSIMVDIKGPDIRTKKVKDDFIHIKEGDAFTFTTREVMGDDTIVSVNYDGLHNDLTAGNEILVQDGKFKFTVTSVDGQDIHTVVTVGGELGNNKNMHFPGVDIKLPFIREKDRGDIAFAVKMDAEYIAASFVSCANDILLVKEELKKCGNENIGIIAKIENEKGVDNIVEILSNCDGLMVARGDLGTEIAFEEVPPIQKYLIHTANEMGKIAITATDMLDSMINNENPTRAEVSDIGNAVYDGTSAVMLSGETSHYKAKFPVEAVTIMAKTCERVEQDIHYRKRFHHRHPMQAAVDINNTVAHSAVASSFDIDARGIIACTLTGGTAKLLSKYKPSSNILALTTDPVVYHKLSMVYNVHAYMVDYCESMEHLYQASVDTLKADKILKSGDPVVFTMGYPFHKKQITNTIRVDIVE